MRNFILFWVLVIISSVAFSGYAIDIIDTGDAAGATLPVYVVVIAGCIYSVIEFLIGKTKVIAPNSLLDIIFQIFIKIYKAIFGDK